MTINQISKCLEEIGNYSFNTIIPLNEVSSIVLNIDQNIYPGKNTRLKFYTEGGNELLLVYDGHENEEGIFEFKYIDEVKHQPIPTYFISFSTIFGFNLKSHIRASEPFKLGMAV